MTREGSIAGGKARAAKMTPEERSESARKAVNARWARYRKSWVSISLPEHWFTISTEGSWGVQRKSELCQSRAVMAATDIRTMVADTGALA